MWAGRGAYRRGLRPANGNSRRGIHRPRREAMGKACGVPMAMPLGQSRAPNLPSEQQ